MYWCHLWRVTSCNFHVLNFRGFNCVILVIFFHPYSGRSYTESHTTCFWLRFHFFFFVASLTRTINQLSKTICSDVYSSYYIGKCNAIVACILLSAIVFGFIWLNNLPVKSSMWTCWPKFFVVPHHVPYRPTWCSTCIIYSAFLRVLDGYRSLIPCEHCVSKNRGVFSLVLLTYK
jgi:hypothetical protein